jgi:hypothetical protein
MHAGASLYQHLPVLNRTVQRLTGYIGQDDLLSRDDVGVCGYTVPELLSPGGCFI